MDEKVCTKCKGTKYLDPDKWYASPTTILMRELGVCFTCACWTERSRKTDDVRSLVIKGVAYWLGAEDAPAKGMRGFDGRHFLIRRLSETEPFATTNLWCSGDVPECFRDVLPDNAEFVTGG
jgi:hypothetical protein